MIALFMASITAIHFCGKVRHAVFREQLVDHSALFAPNKRRRSVRKIVTTAIAGDPL